MGGIGMDNYRAASPADAGLTPRQQKIVHAVNDSVRRRGYWPTYREIGEQVGLASTSSVSYQVSRLQERGVLTREPRRPRTTMLRLQHGQASPVGVHAADGIVRVPVAGRIAAGNPIMMAGEHGEFLLLPRQLVGHGDVMALTVAGDSMTGAAIADGDWVVVRRQNSADSGQIVAAMIEGDAGWEATVKTFRRKDGRYWLEPHNAAYRPIPAEQAMIIGKVVTVVRRV
jgi:repressor LexA